jgi:hypothetical protein
MTTPFKMDETWLFARLLPPSAYKIFIELTKEGL